MGFDVRSFPNPSNHQFEEQTFAVNEQSKNGQQAASSNRLLETVWSRTQQRELKTLSFADPTIRIDNELRRISQLRADNPATARNAIEPSKEPSITKVVPGAKAINAKPWESCPASPIYQEVINKAARNMYDPQRLGDLTEALNKYNCEIKTPRDAVAKANLELQSTGDRFNHMIFPEGIESFDDHKNGKYFGIGVDYIKDADVPLKVTGVTPGGPAEIAGIKVGSIIEKINNLETRTMSSDEVQNALRGADKSQVRITIASPTFLNEKESLPAQNKDQTTVGTSKEATNSTGKESDHDSLSLTKKATTFATGPGAMIESSSNLSKEVTLTRAQFAMPPEVTDTVDKGDGIAYFRIKSFDRNQLADEIQQSVEKQRDAKAYIIDLRGNPGGLVDAAVDTASLFMDSGTVYNMQRRKESDPLKPEYTQEYQRITANSIEVVRDGVVAYTRARHKNIAGDKPIIILTNNDTASASEIFSAAMHDYNRAELVGDRTFGKGIGQNWYDTPLQSRLYITSAKITSPHNFWFGDAHNNRIGIEPDRKVLLHKDAVWNSPEDNQLAVSMNILRQKLAAVEH